MINTVLKEDMPLEIKGHANMNRDGSYTIFINAKHCFETQQKAFLHEMGHILNGDFDKECADEIEAFAHREDRHGIT